MTLYETRKILTGFRLKLHFDQTLRQEDAFVYVDLSKTPTVGALLQEIANRFEIPHKDLLLTLESCKLLQSENVCVLADVDNARVGISSTDESHQQPAFKNAIIDAKNTDISPCKIEILQSSNPTKLPSDNFTDNANKKNETKAPKIYRSHARQGVAYFLQKLREEHKTSTENEDEISTELGTDMQKSKIEHKKKSGNVDSSFVNMSCDISSCNGDISESAPTDNQEFVQDVKKRKRKRKHSRKTRDEEYTIAESTYSEPFVAPDPAPRSRTHIYFKDDDIEDDVAEEVNMDTSDSRDSRFTSVEMLPKSTYNNDISVQKETVASKTITTDGSRKCSPHPSVSPFATWKPLNRSSDTIKDSNDISVQKEAVVFKAVTTDGSHRCSPHSPVSPFTTWKSVNRSSDTVKDTSADITSNTMTKETQAIDSKKAELNNDSKSPNYMPPSPINFQKQLSTFTFPKKKPSTQSLFRQNLAKDKETEQKIEEKLSTLLMCKELKTYNHYVVQFPNQSNSDQRKISSNEIPKKLCSDAEDSSFESTGSRIFVKKKSSILNNDVQVGDNTRSNIIGNDADRMKNETSDCEVLKQFKLSETHLLMRKPNEDWVLVTPHVAAQEFTVVEVPKENQTIVFQVYYLDEKLGPTISDLICAQIVCIKGEDVAIDIPQQFQQKIFHNSLNGIESEEFVPVTGTTYQVPFSYLKNARLVS